MSRHYELLTYRPEPLDVRHGDEFRPWKRFRWLETLAKRLWCRLSQPHIVTETRYRRHVLTNDRIIELLYAGKYDIEEIFHRRLKHLVIGWGQFDDLRAVEVGMACNLSIELPIYDGSKKRVLGLDVHVVSWFDGILMLPDWSDL